MHCGGRSSGWQSSTVDMAIAKSRSCFTTKGGIAPDWNRFAAAAIWQPRFLMLLKSNIGKALGPALVFGEGGVLQEGDDVVDVVGAQGGRRPKGEDAKLTRLMIDVQADAVFNCRPLCICSARQSGVDGGGGVGIIAGSPGVAGGPDAAGS